MRCLKFALLGGVIAATAAAQQNGFYAEVGASYLSLHGARFERSPAPLQTMGGKARTAPFITAGYRVDSGLGVRLSYHAIGDIEAVAKFGSPPDPKEPVNTPVVVWGGGGGGGGGQADLLRGAGSKLGVESRARGVYDGGSDDRGDPATAAQREWLYAGRRGRRLVCDRGADKRVIDLSLHGPRSEFRPAGARDFRRVEVGVLSGLGM